MTHTQAKRDAVAAAYAAGAPSTEVAAQHDVSVPSVLKWARAAGVPIRRAGGNRSQLAFSDEDKEDAVTMYNNGASGRWVADALNTSAVTVYKWVRAAGHPVRNQGRPVGFRV